MGRVGRKPPDLSIYWPGIPCLVIRQLRLQRRGSPGAEVKSLRQRTQIAGDNGRIPGTGLVKAGRLVAQN